MYIEFNINKKFIYIIFFSFCYGSYIFFIRYLSKHFGKNNKKNSENASKILLLIVLSINSFNIISIFFFFIQKKINKKHIIKSKQPNIIIINKIVKNDLKFFSKENISFIILINLIFISIFSIQYPLFYLSKITFVESNFILQISIFIIGLFKYIKKEKIYKHHKLSFIILFLSSLYYLITYYIRSNKIPYFTGINYYIYLGILFEILKYLIEIKFINIFVILFYRGFINLILFISFIFIFDNNNVIKKFHDFIKEKVILFIIFIFINFIMKLTELKIISELPTSNLIIGYLIGLIYYLIFHLFNYGRKKLIFVFIDFSVIIGTMIYSEIIILKFCGLEYNTEKYIKEREKNDVNVDTPLLYEAQK